MNAFLLYVVQSALCLSLFYGLYLLLLRREAFFRFNRSVLLTIMITSMVLPLIRIPVAEPTLIQKVSGLPSASSLARFEFEVSGWAKPVDDLELETSNLELETSNLKLETSNSQLDTSASRVNFNAIPLIYLAGFLVSLVLALVSFVSVARIIVTARPVIYRQQRILVSPLQISSFTFAGWIVLSEMDYERFAAEIITHENIHRRKGHFCDLCFISAITVVHWFNPLVWLLRRELKALHEYEADRSTLTQGIDATRYQLLLIEKAAGASRYTVASSFAQSKIKKRISMMNKQNLNPWARWKALLFIPLAALLLQAFARPEIKRELEQISTLKSTEVLQESSNWTVLKGDSSKTKTERIYTHVYKFGSPAFNIKGGAVEFSDEERKEITREFEEISDQEVMYNGQMKKISEISELLTKDTDGKLMIIYKCCYDPKAKERMCTVGLSLPAIDPKDPAYYYLKNGKWIYGGKGINVDQIKSIDTYASEIAVKRYGSKAKNGAIAITTKE